MACRMFRGATSPTPCRRGRTGLGGVQAPHAPWFHPFFVPVRPRCSREASSSEVRGSSSSEWSVPLTLRFTSTLLAGESNPAWDISLEGCIVASRPLALLAHAAFRQINGRVLPAIFRDGKLSRALCGGSRAQSNSNMLKRETLRFKPSSGP
jgi:hypothetical protein